MVEGNRAAPRKETDDHPQVVGRKSNLNKTQHEFDERLLGHCTALARKPTQPQEPRFSHVSAGLKTPMHFRKFVNQCPLLSGISTYPKAPSMSPGIP